MLPHCRARDIQVLVYGPLAHGMLTGTLTTDTTFAADGWRDTSSVSPAIPTGAIWRRLLRDCLGGHPALCRGQAWGARAGGQCGGQPTASKTAVGSR
ncbi:hypothetical protein OYT95_37185 [Rhodococcus sp. JS3073]|nr:hypothetical protein OYT95_37185 [Rhodococcus sp. JS3073]